MRLFFTICALVAAMAAALFVVMPQFTVKDIVIACLAMMACLCAAEFGAEESHHG